jgi:hypothetical protein
LIKSICRQFQFTSPQWGEVDLLMAMRSIVKCKSGEGAGSIRVSAGCAATSMRHHDKIRVFFRLAAQFMVGNNQ